MQTALRITLQVQPGGRIELVDSHLPDGSSVEVIVLLPQADVPARRSIVDVLADAPGKLAFKTADDVDSYLRAERDAWEE